MKSNSLLTPLVAALLLSSCVAEDLFNGPDAPGRSTTLSLAFTLTAPTTKAVGDAYDPYTHATREELEVSQAQIAIFQLDAPGQPGKLVYNKPVTYGEELTDITLDEADIDPSVGNGDESDVKAYQVNNIPAKTGNVRVLVIANSKLDFSKCKFYADFIAKVEETEFPATFNPATLVKVGYFDDLLTTTNKTILVPMTQLAARVDFTITMGLPPTNTVSFIDHSSEIDAIFDGLGKGTDQIQSAIVTRTLKDGTVMTFCADNHSSIKTCPGVPNGTKYENPYKAGVKETATDGKIAHATNVPFDKVTTSDRWGLHIKKILINNIETKSDLMLDNPTIYANTQAVTPPSSRASYEFPSPKDTITNTFTLRFYTYEKPLYGLGNIDEAVTLSFDAELIKGKTEKRERFVAVAAHGVWIFTDAPGNAKSDWGKPSSGWGEDKKGITRFILVKIDQEQAIDPNAVPKDVFNKDLGYEVLPKNYTVIINPSKSMAGCNTDGLIHGNRYAVGTTLNSVTTDFELRYQVADWTSVIKTIPDFN